MGPNCPKELSIRASRRNGSQFINGRGDLICFWLIHFIHEIAFHKAFSNTTCFKVKKCHLVTGCSCIEFNRCQRACISVRKIQTDTDVCVVHAYMESSLSLFSSVTVYVLLRRLRCNELPLYTKVRKHFYQKLITQNPWKLIQE